MARTMEWLVRRILLLSLLPVVGCATSRGESDLLGAPQIRTVTAGSVSSGGETAVAGATTIRYEEQPILVEELVDAGVGEVFPALLAAFRSEGLLPDGVDPESGIVSLSRAEWSGERNGRRLSSFLDCGPSATGQPMADDARVVVSIAAQARESGPGSTRVTQRLGASAYPFESLGGGVRGCVTTGELERTILDRIRAAIAPGPPGAQATGETPRAGPTPPVVRAAPGSPDLPFQTGDRLRVWVWPGDRLTGAFLGVGQDTLVLGTGRRTPIPLGWIQEIQVKRTRRAAIAVATLVGAAAGIAIASTTDLGIVGSHSVQGEILNPGLGALAGGLAGALVGSVAFGTSWVQVPLGAVRSGSGLPPPPVR